MDQDVNETLDGAIVKMAEQAKANQDSQKSLHYSQAALNLAHVKSLLENTKSGNKARASA